MGKSLDGKFITHNITLTSHEQATLDFLLRQGHDIELIPPSNIYGRKNADCIMDHLIWEIKSPKGKSKYLIRDTLSRASKQSCNIILDLRRTKLNHYKCVREAERYFAASRHIKRLKIILNQKTVLDYNKPGC